MPFKIEIEDEPDAATRRLIDEGLERYNTARAGPDGAKDLWVLARNGRNEVQGGLKGRTFYGWFFIDWLWVADDSRGSGIGDRLMDKAEAEAQARGCIGAYVDTYSFQAPAFYERHGYAEFGRIDDLPPGHACIWLKKTF